jgi:hypothetical protein
MKRLALVAAVFAVAACAQNDAATADSTTPAAGASATAAPVVDTTVKPDSLATDTTAKDSAAAHDTTKH